MQVLVLEQKQKRVGVKCLGGWEVLTFEICCRNRSIYNIAVKVNLSLDLRSVIWLEI